MHPAALKAALAGGATVALCASPFAAGAQTHAPADSAPAITVTPSFGRDAWVASDAPLALRLSRRLGPDEGRLAVFVGAVDFSALFAVAGDSLSFQSRGVALPAGESEVVAYVVSVDGAWREVGRVPLRVLTPRRFEKADARPTVAVNNKGQIAERHDPAENRPPRPTFQDFSLTAGLQSEHVQGGWTVRTQSNLLGVSNREEALRFGERRDDAPRFDLSDYTMRAEHARAALVAGNLSYGSQRHIIAAFDSRGLSTTVRAGGAASVTLAGLSGTRLVGFGNALGVGRPDHRLLGGTVSLDLVRQRPQSVVLELSALDGAVLPQTGFGQGAVVDAERSRSAGVRLGAADPSGRLRLEAGYARTRFTNPVDPALAQGTSLVPVRPTTRGARYADLTYDVLRSVALTRSLPVNVALALRHERVEPLYRSVAAPQTRADLAHNGMQVTAAVGALTAQLTHARDRDNLADIPTILTTRTRSTAGNLAAPLGSLLARTPRAWLPTLTYGAARIHQFADSVPTQGGFTSTFVPDQVSTTQTLGAAWQTARWRVTYQLNHSAQDNRQPGRERSDLVNVANGLSLGFTPRTALDVALDAALERATNKELARRTTTQRLGALLTWRATPRTALVAGASRTRTADRPRTGERSGTDVRLELSQQLNLLRASARRPPAQLFLRYASLTSSQLVPAGPRDARRNWSLSSGFALNLF